MGTPSQTVDAHALLSWSYFYQVRFGVGWTYFAKLYAWAIHGRIDATGVCSYKWTRKRDIQIISLSANCIWAICPNKFNLLFIRTNLIFIRTIYYFVRTNLIFVRTIYLFYRTNLLFVWTIYEFVRTNFLFVRTINLFVRTIKLIRPKEEIHVFLFTLPLSTAVV